MPGIALGPEFLDGIIYIITNFYVVIFIIAFLMFVSVYKIFDNERISGWRALIPVYNTMTLYDIVELPKWFGIVLWIPIINFSYIYLFPLLCIRLSKKYKKGIGYGILMVILPFIFFPLMVYKIPNINILLKRYTTKDAVVVGNEADIIDVKDNTPVPEVSEIEDLNIEYTAQDINPYDEPTVEEEIEVTVNKTPMDLLYEMPDLSMGDKSVTLKTNEEKSDSSEQS